MCNSRLIYLAAIPIGVVRPGACRSNRGQDGIPDPISDAPMRLVEAGFTGWRGA
jgi:hypothetical protein